MPGYEDRETILQGTGDIIFNMVCERATPEQWADWLRAPLEHAASMANADLVDKLLKAGANGGAGWKGCNGHTLLHAGAEGGDEQVLTALMDSESRQDVNTRAEGLGRTPLHVAAAHGKVAAAKVLILAGADVNSLDVNRDGPLHLAIEGGHEGLAEDLLLSGADPHLRSGSSSPPIYLAVHRGLAGVVRNLLHKGVCANFHTPGEYTPLMWAVHRGFISTVQVLLRAGADATHDRSRGLTALHVAAFRNKGPDIIEALVDAGADIEARMRNGDTPLLHSAPYTLSVALLRMGANVNAKGNDGYTPLHLVCSQLDAAGADQLLRWGADETAVDEHGRTPSERIPRWARSSEEHRPSLERLSKLLTFAPQDRAWRRRGFLVLCRAHPDRLRLARDTPNTAESAVSQPPERPCRRSRVRQEEVENTARVGVGGGSASTERMDESDSPGGGGSDEFDAVAAWLMWLTHEDVFRRVVGYL